MTEVVTVATAAHSARARIRRAARRVPGALQCKRRLSSLRQRGSGEPQQELDRLRRENADQRARLEQIARHPGAEFVPPGHFYSAVPDPAEAQYRHADLMRRPPDDVPGVDLDLAGQWAVLELLEPMMESVPFGDAPGSGLRYGFKNGAYSYGDGTMLHLMLRLLQPKRLIEVGSGHSSACTLDTVDRFLGGDCDLTFIEPYDELLRSLISSTDEERVRIVPEPVQNVSVETFRDLRDRDLLFIDSTHVCKVGSDVNYLFFEVLPRLHPGVVVHIHDIFPRFEYPWPWIAEGRAWQEDYLLRAFLQFNAEFEVLLWPSLLAQLDPDRVYGGFPTMRRNPGGSIYLRRTGGSPLVPADR